MERASLFEQICSNKDPGTQESKCQKGNAKWQESKCQIKTQGISFNLFFVVKASLAFGLLFLVFYSSLEELP